MFVSEVQTKIHAKSLSNLIRNTSGKYCGYSPNTQPRYIYYIVEIQFNVPSSIYFRLLRNIQINPLHNSYTTGLESLRIGFLTGSCIFYGEDVEL